MKIKDVWFKSIKEDIRKERKTWIKINENNTYNNIFNDSFFLFYQIPCISLSIFFISYSLKQTYP